MTRTERKRILERIERLKKMLSTAEKSHNYEMAKHLRDEIERLRRRLSHKGIVYVNLRRRCAP